MASKWKMIITKIASMRARWQLVADDVKGPLPSAAISKQKVS